MKLPEVTVVYYDGRWGPWWVASVQLFLVQAHAAVSEYAAARTVALKRELWGTVFGRSYNRRNESPRPRRERSKPTRQWSDIGAEYIPKVRMTLDLRPPSLGAPVVALEDVSAGKGHVMVGELDRQAATLVSRNYASLKQRSRRSRRYEGFAMSA